MQPFSSQVACNYWKSVAIETFRNVHQSPFNMYHNNAIHLQVASEHQAPVILQILSHQCFQPEHTQ